MPALNYHFLLLLLFFLLLAASWLGSQYNTIGILSSIILRRKSSLDLRKPLIERGFPLSWNRLVLVIVNYTCSNHGLFPSFVKLVYLSGDIITMLCVLAEEDPWRLRLQDRLNIKGGRLLWPLAENPWLWLVLRPLLPWSHFCIYCILTSRHVGDFDPGVDPTFRLSKRALLTKSSLIIYLLFWHEPSRALLTSKLGSFLHGLVLESIEDRVELARLLLLFRFTRLWLDLVSGNYGWCVSYI